MLLGCFLKAGGSLATKNEKLNIDGIFGMSEI